LIDTVQLKFRRIPTTEQLHDHWEQMAHTIPGSPTPRLRYVYNTQPSDGIALKATYLPQDYHGQGMLLIELSLPKALFGVNWRMIPDIPSAISASDSAIRLLPGLPDLGSIGHGEIVRLDACYNYQVGDDMQPYLQALSRLEYPRRQTVPFLGTGVEYRSRRCKTKFYDKYAETDKRRLPPELWPPIGTLRHETTYRRSREVKSACRVEREETLTLADLDPDAVLEILRRDLAFLGIYGCSFATRELALERLCHRYGENRGLRLFGALHAQQENHRKTFANKVRIERHSVSRLLRDLHASGIAPAIVEGKPLPPLEITWPPENNPLPAPRRSPLASEESSPSSEEVSNEITSK